MVTDRASQRRGRLLAQLITEGKLKPQQLSAQDLSKAGPEMGKSKLKTPDVGGMSGFGGFFENLGSDIFDAAKGLPAGLVNTGISAAADIGGAVNPGLKGLGDLKFGSNRKQGSAVYENIIKPTLDSYAYTYLGKGAPKSSSLGERIYEHPLGPLLDTASVLSLGAGGVARGGAALARAGRIAPDSTLATLGATKGRAPISLDTELSGREPQLQVPQLQREYSSRPLRKGIQVTTDKLAEHFSPVEAIQRSATRSHQQRVGFAGKEAEAQAGVQQQVAPLISQLQKLSPDETVAFDLINRGLVTTDRISEFENTVGDNLAQGGLFEKFAGTVDPKLPESRANIPETAKTLALNPAGSENLMNAVQAYRDVVRDRVTSEMEPGEVKAKSGETLNALYPPLHDSDERKLFKAQNQEGIYIGDLLKSEPPVEPGHPFPEPTVMPSDVASGFKWEEPGSLAKRMTDREGSFTRGRQGGFNPSNVNYQNLFQDPKSGLRPNPEPILAGVTRPDARSFVDFIARRERELVEKVYNEDQLHQVSLKDEHGEPVSVPSTWSQKQVQNKFGPNWVSVSPEGRMAFFNKEMTAAQAISKMEEAGFDLNSKEALASMGAEAQDAAIDSTLSARHTPAWVVPKDYAEYARRLETASDPYSFAPARVYARSLNFWRTWTLSMMPRWALNTAVGSAGLSTIKGVGPRDYMHAKTLSKAGGFEGKDTAGVNLGSVIGMELLESGAQGYLDRTAGIKVGPGHRWAMQKVQAIEDYFRRGSFVHSLDKQAQQHLSEQGAIISNLERAKGPRSTEEYLDFIKDNPEAVKAAIEDVNRFAYNFAALGPSERRYVRQVVPFWGWYKFISGLAYRLPVDYPGRTDVLAHLGMLGSQQTEETLGKVPPWLKGAVPLGMNGGVLSYLSTTGLNPLSQFFNPVGPEGASGVFQMGQASPLIQAGLSAMGYDTMRSGEVAISPEAGLAPSFLGRMIDTNKGEATDVGAHEWKRRFLASILRSFPQVRIGERFQSGGRSVYPESLPWSPRYMPTKEDVRFGGTLPEVLEQWVGVAPRKYALKRNQRLLKKELKYAKARLKSSKKRHK